ncbi:hypothetical protein [Burkholderia sp. S-53]|nr:hypothetical protein [Burkholderia sp. S-53]UXU85453.1 hypothetical protein LXM88_03590 [Burkholderia sp. S-53]
MDGSDLPACGNFAGSRRAFTVARRQAREGSERTPTGAYPAAMRRVLKSR